MGRTYQKEHAKVNSGANPFQERIDKGEVSTLEELKAWYRTEAKRLHPDLQGSAAPGVDFDQLKQDYHDAYQHLLKLQDQSVRAEPETEPIPEKEPPGGFANRDAFLDEFRNLVARGFPINLQAAAKNRAYAVCIRRVSAYLNDHFGDPEFFVRVNGETRSLKRTDPTSHWYVLQIYWNIGDWRVTGFDYYRRIFIRHLNFIRESLQEAGYETLLRTLEYLTEATLTRTSTPEGSRSPRSGT